MKPMGLLFAVALMCGAFVGPALADTDADKARLAEVTAQENTLVFDSFDNATALQLGMAMVQYAQETKAPQTVFDIRRNGQILFRVALAGGRPSTTNIGSTRRSRGGAQDGLWPSGLPLLCEKRVPR
jgi:hypothetical protein